MKKLFLYLILLASLIPLQAIAGKYKMVRDSIFEPQPNGITKVEEHAEVCTAFLKNLEANPPFPPMACDVMFKPEFSEFQTPEWQDIDVWENQDLWLGRAPRPLTEAEKDYSLKELKDRIKAGTIFFRTAQFDIDNDGVSDQVLRFSNDKCDPANGKTNDRLGRNHPSYTVYDPVSRKVDVKKEKFYNSFYYWQSMSLFSYRGVTYYADLFGDTASDQHFGKFERRDKKGFYPTKYYIKLTRPIPMTKGVDQPVALGCEYLYLPTKHEGGY